MEIVLIFSLKSKKPYVAKGWILVFKIRNFQNIHSLIFHTVT